METEARAELARVASDGLDEFRASLWLASLTYLTDACAALGDEETAALVYAELAPFGGGNVMIGHVVACYGAADRYLGMLAATLGEWERAELHFERAMALNRRMGAARVAHTAYEYGRMLHRRGGAHRERGAALLGEAATLAARIGMPALLARVRGLSSPRPALPDGLRRERRRSSTSSPRACPTARSAGGCTSASTPPRTTSGASCARPAARTAPKPRPTPTGTGWPGRTVTGRIGRPCRST